MRLRAAGVVPPIWLFAVRTRMPSLVGQGPRRAGGVRADEVAHDGVPIAPQTDGEIGVVDDEAAHRAGARVDDEAVGAPAAQLDEKDGVVADCERVLARAGLSVTVDDDGVGNAGQRRDGRDRVHTGARYVEGDRVRAHIPVGIKNRLPE